MDAMQCLQEAAPAWPRAHTARVRTSNTDNIPWATQATERTEVVLEHHLWHLCKVLRLQLLGLCELVAHLLY